MKPTLKPVANEIWQKVAARQTAQKSLKPLPVERVAAATSEQIALFNA